MKPLSQVPMTRQWMTLSTIEGHIAMWAVRQSPYHFPDDLQGALRVFRTRMEPICDENQMIELDRDTLKKLIHQLFLSQGIVTSWNQRRNQREGYGFVSRYSKPQPDDDFIDLDALTANVVTSVFRELQE